MNNNSDINKSIIIEQQNNTEHDDVLNNIDDIHDILDSLISRHSCMKSIFWSGPHGGCLSSYISSDSTKAIETFKDGTVIEHDLTNNTEKELLKQTQLEIKKNLAQLEQKTNDAKLLYTKRTKQNNFNNNIQHE